MTDEEIAERVEALMHAHPGGATATALKRVQEYLDTGDLETAATWSRIAALISEREALDATRPIMMIM